MQKIELQPAFVLHARPYRDTSLIVEFFTLNHGRVAAVARGVRKVKSPKRSMLNPFIPLLISVQGKGGLKLLTHVEMQGVSYLLEKDRLYSGLYLNELLMRLLPEWDEYEEIYLRYIQAILALKEQPFIEPTLRAFERTLLQALGYGVDWFYEAHTHAAIQPDLYYTLDSQQGFINFAADEFDERAILGADILRGAELDFSSASTLKAAKLINRLLLKPLLGSKPLQSRALFIKS